LSLSWCLPRLCNSTDASVSWQALMAACRGGGRGGMPGEAHRTEKKRLTYSNPRKKRDLLVVLCMCCQHGCRQQVARPAMAPALPSGRFHLGDLILMRWGGWHCRRAEERWWAGQQKNKKREREAHSLEREDKGVDVRSNGYQDGALKIMCVWCKMTGKRMAKAFHRRVVWPQEKSEQVSGLQQPLAKLVKLMTAGLVS